MRVDKTMILALIAVLGYLGLIINGIALMEISANEDAIRRKIKYVDWYITYHEKKYHPVIPVIPVIKECKKRCKNVDSRTAVQKPVSR